MKRLLIAIFLFALNTCYGGPATSTTFNWAIGGTTAVTIMSGVTIVSVNCSTLDFVAVDNTHQTAIATTNTNTTLAPIQAFDTYTLTNNNTINVTQTAAGTADVYTAYSLTVDLY